MAVRIRKVIGVLLLITAFLVTQMPGSETSAAASADFQMDNGTLVKYVGTASSVSIPSSVNKIGAEAFAGNNNLTTVSIGKNVTEIEYGAFRDCPYLSKVVLPDSLEKMGNSVFSNNFSLKKITLNENLKEIGSGVFAGCERLTTIEVDKDNNNFVFSQNCLYNKDKTILYCYAEGASGNKYTMPSTVEEIDEYAFWGNDNLKQITLSSSLKEIPSYAFSNCKNLSAIAVPYSVKSIHSKAFENCSNLIEAEIPASVSYIHSSAFDGCPLLEIEADEGTEAYEFYESWKLLEHSSGSASGTGTESTEGSTVVDEEGKVYIVGGQGQLIEVDEEEDSSSDGNNNTRVSAIHDPSNVDYVPEYDPLTDVEEEDGILGKTMVVGQSAVVMLDPQSQAVSGLENREVLEEEEAEVSQSFVDEGKGDALPKFAVVDNRIAANAFYGDEELTSYTIPDNITTIGDFAFARTGLESITIPSGVREIGYAAFYHCDYLTEISIPDSVIWIEPSAFAYSGWLTGWGNNKENSDFLIVGDGILLAYKGNSRYVEIPDGVETIAPACFTGHEEIEGVSIPDSVTIIGEEAFLNCTALKNVHGGSNLIKIQDRAFKNTNLSEITIHKYVEEIGVAAFDCEDNGTERIAAFEGSVLPVLSYTDSTSRISQDELRGPVFDGNWTAVLAQKNIETEGTIFEDNGKGFTGDLAVADGNGNRTVIGNRKSKQTLGNTVKVNSDVAQWPADEVSVQLPYNGEYHLNIREEGSGSIADGYKRIYGENLPEMLVFDMTLYDDTDSIAFTKFGLEPMVVTAPLPSNITGNTVHVVAMDEDGQLEKLSASIQEKDGQDYVQFSTNHLSTFAIYALGDGGSVHIEDGEATYTTPSSKKDYSPNTGDNSIEPKWFVAVGMAALAVILILYRPKRRKY